MERAELSRGMAGSEEDGPWMGTYLQERPEERAQINLPYSADDPDVFALVTGVLQQVGELEADTNRDSHSESFSPSWTTEVGNSSRSSDLFPMESWDPDRQNDAAESPRSDEEALVEEEPSPPEELSRDLEDLQVTDSEPLPSPPGSPPAREVLDPFDPQNKDFPCEDLNWEFSGVPEWSNGSEELEACAQDDIAPQISPEFSEDPQETPGASGPAEPVQMAYRVTEGIWCPAIPNNNLFAEGGAYESPQFVLTPVQQVSSTAQGANIALHPNYVQNCTNIPSGFISNVPNTNLIYSVRGASRPVRPPPGFEHHIPSYRGVRWLNTSFNPAGVSYAINNVPMQMNPQPCVTYGSFALPLGSQTAPPQYHGQQNCGFPTCEGGLSLSGSVGCSWVDEQAPPEEGHLGESPRSVSSRGGPGGPSAHRFANLDGLDSAANEDGAGEEMGQIERWDRMNPATGGLGGTQLDVMRSQKKIDHIFNFINPLFLPYYPLASDYSRALQCPVYYPRPYMNNLLCRGIFAPYSGFSPLFPRNESFDNQPGPAQSLFVSLEECYNQWRALERERTKIEADLARLLPDQAFTITYDVSFPRLPFKPTRVDRLIWIQFHERARVSSLLQKMEEFWNVAIHRNIAEILARHLHAIRVTHNRRRDEIRNANRRWRPGSLSYIIRNEKAVLALASALNELTSCTRKTRTALWCAFQHIVFPKLVPRVPDENALEVASTSFESEAVAEEGGEEEREEREEEVEGEEEEEEVEREVAEEDEGEGEEE